MKNIADKILSVNDARYFAEKRVPKGIFQMFEAGSGSTVTAHWRQPAIKKSIHKEFDLIDNNLVLA